MFITESSKVGDISEFTAWKMKVKTVYTIIFVVTFSTVIDPSNLKNIEREMKYLEMYEKRHKLVLFFFKIILFK